MAPFLRMYNAKIIFAIGVLLILWRVLTEKGKFLEEARFENCFSIVFFCGEKNNVCFCLFSTAAFRD